MIAEKVSLACLECMYLTKRISTAMLRAVLILLILPAPMAESTWTGVNLFLQAWLSGFIGKALVNIILESEFP